MRAHLGQYIGSADYLIGFTDIIFRERLDKRRNVNVRRTGDGTGSGLAVMTATRFLPQIVEREVAPVAIFRAIDLAVFDDTPCHASIPHELDTG